MPLLPGTQIAGATPTAMPMRPQSAPVSAAAPAAAPMSTQQQPVGLQAAAAAQIQISIKLLERALPVMGSTTDQGRAILAALKTLTNQFPMQESRVQELIPAEVRQLAASVQGAPASPRPTMGGGGGMGIGGMGGGMMRGMPPFQGV